MSMRPVERYRAWALRGPFVLTHTAGEITVAWPTADLLLHHNRSASLATRLAILAGESAPEILSLAGEEDYEVLRLIVDDMAEFFGCCNTPRLLGLVDRYGDKIASDLQQLYQLDLGALFRGDIVPDQMMARIDDLPRHSRLSEALAQDDELAARYEPQDGAPPRVQEIPFTDWTPETERLTTIADRLGDILSAIAAVAGARVNVPRQPRPAGASARLRDKQDEDAYEELLADVEQAKQRWLSENPNHTPEEG